MDKNINVRLPSELVGWLMEEAASEQSSLSFVVRRHLRGAYAGRSTGEAKARESSGRGTDPPAVSTVRTTEKPAKRLHPMHAVRDELAGRGGSVTGRQIESCTALGHKTFKNGAGHYCMTCNTNVD